MQTPSLGFPLAFSFVSLFRGFTDSGTESLLAPPYKIRHCLTMSTGMTATLKKWGNSIGLVLPAGIAKATQLASGTRVEIDVSDGALVIRKAPGQP
jgi:hypothetical protein